MLSGSPALSTLPELGYLIFLVTIQRRCYYHTHFTDETEAQRDRDLPTASEGWRETGVLVQPRPYFPLTRVGFLLKPASWREQDINDDGHRARQAEATQKG